MGSHGSLPKLVDTPKYTKNSDVAYSFKSRENCGSLPKLVEIHELGENGNVVEMAMWHILGGPCASHIAIFTKFTSFNKFR